MAMRREPPEQKNRNQWMLTCVGVSVVLGVVIGHLVNFEALAELHLVSLTGVKPVADLLLIALFGTGLRRLLFPCAPQ